MIFNDEELGLRVREKFQLLGGSQFAIDRDEHAAAEENRVRRNQPLRLIRHEDGSACAALQSCALQRTRERQGGFLELAIREPNVFAFAISLDEADLVRPAV